jgi:hypothetical protein
MGGTGIVPVIAVAGTARETNAMMPAFCALPEGDGERTLLLPHHCTVLYTTAGVELGVKEGHEILEFGT